MPLKEVKIHNCVLLLKFFAFFCYTAGMLLLSRTGPAFYSRMEKHKIFEKIQIFYLIYTPLIKDTMKAYFW